MINATDKMDEYARQLRALSNNPIPSSSNHLQLLIQQEVQRQLAALPAPAAARQGHTEQMLMVLLEKNLPPADMAWLTGEHIPAGAPGFVEFLNSDTAKTLVQMAFDAYKEFLAGQRK